jgi:hypothetical protein
MTAKQLFSSGFEGNISLGPLGSGYPISQTITGTDSQTGYSWPMNLWGGQAGIVSLAANVSTQIETVTGHTGTPTQALYTQVNSLSANYGQVALGVTPTADIAHEGDLYTSEWIMFPQDMISKLGTSGTDSWKALFEWKTGDGTAVGSGGGDFRSLLGFGKFTDGSLHWQVKWDNNANNPNLPLQTYYNDTNMNTQVPVGRWFHLETFTHRDNVNGEFWVKVDGQTIFDHTGDNIGSLNLPINRIALFNNYSNPVGFPMGQWLDDVQIWDGQPSDCSVR